MLAARLCPITTVGVRIDNQLLLAAKSVENANGIEIERLRRDRIAVARRGANDGSERYDHVCLGQEFGQQRLITCVAEDEVEFWIGAMMEQRRLAEHKRIENGDFMSCIQKVLA